MTSSEELTHERKEWHRLESSGEVRRFILDLIVERDGANLDETCSGLIGKYPYPCGREWIPRSEVKRGVSRVIRKMLKRKEIVFDLQKQQWVSIRGNNEDNPVGNDDPYPPPSSVHTVGSAGLYGLGRNRRH